MIETLKENGLFLVLIVLPIAIVAHNLFGAALAGVDHDKKFNKQILKEGLIKGALVYSGILLYALISYLMLDLKIELGGELYTLIDAMYIIVLGTVVRYSTQGITKLAKIMKYKITEEEEEKE